jgi:Domain of unknown function (DUF1924)
MTVNTTRRTPHLALLLVLALASGGSVQASPAEILAAYTAKAGSPASPDRGQKFFNQKWKGGLFESCTDCHTTNPAARGRDQTSEKPLAPMALSANAKRFTDASKVETYFRLNCKDTVGRECSAQEKADVLSWLINVKP